MRGIKLTLLAVGVAVIFSLSISLIAQKTRDAKRATTKAKFEQIGKGMAEYATNYRTILPGSGRIRKKNQNETFEELFTNLSQTNPAPSSLATTPGAYSYDSMCLSSSSEIRGLLAEARTEPAKITAFLRKQMAEITAKFPAAIAKSSQFKNTYLAGSQEHKDRIAIERYKFRGAVALYLLADIKDFESLPMMASHLPAEGESFEHYSRVLVNPKWALYSMHRLISQMPTEGLSTEAQDSRDEYLRLAEKKGILEPIIRARLIWMTHYYEPASPRQLDVEPNVVPTIDMADYPHQLESLSASDLEALSSAMKSFVSLAFANETAEE